LGKLGGIFLFLSKNLRNLMVSDPLVLGFDGILTGIWQQAGQFSQLLLKGQRPVLGVKKWDGPKAGRVVIVDTQVHHYYPPVSGKLQFLIGAR